MDGQVLVNMHLPLLRNGDQPECGGNTLQDLGSGSLLATPTTCGHIADHLGPHEPGRHHPPGRPDPWVGDGVHWPEKKTTCTGQAPEVIWLHGICHKTPPSLYVERLDLKGRVG